MDSSTTPLASAVAAWRERLSGRAWAVAAGVGGVTLAVAALVLLLRQPFGPPPQLTLPRAGDASTGTAVPPGSPPAPPPGSAAAPGTAPALVTVHAAGAVARPGVYALPTGARVADLLTAAGGPSPEADLDRLNLAARVNDGERVSVARKGDPATPPSGEGASGGPSPGVSAGPPGAPTAPASGPLDLNAATAEQLDTLPGIGPATARSILTYRQRHGRFRSVTELLEVPGIGPTKLEALRPHVKV